MPHLLVRLQGVSLEAFRANAKQYASEHAKDGLHLEQNWSNADDPREVFLLFRAETVAGARRHIQNANADALKHDPTAKLPQVTFLE